MTSAPPNLLAVRRLLLEHLDIHENSSAYSTDLDPAEVGIVGDTAHIGEGDSYHLGVPEQDVTGRYSVGESPRDSSGLCGFASALDVGTFSVRTATGTHNLISFSRWVVAQCVAGTPDTRDIREVIYSPDGQTVRRWDRLGKRTTGDSSHLFHTHFSFHRDASGRDLTPLFRRYLTDIGLLEDDMPLTSTDADLVGDRLMARKAAPQMADSSSVGGTLYETRSAARAGVNEVRAARGEIAAMRAELAALAGRDLVDEPAIVQGVLAGLDPATLAQRIADALPADQARRVADELAARLAS